MGIPADEMGGCIFDQGYLNIPPNQVPLPSKPNPTETVLGTINRPALHTNQLVFPEENLAPSGNNPLPMEQQKPTMNRENTNTSVEKPERETETRPNGFNSRPETQVNKPAIHSPAQVNPARPSAPASPSKPPHSPTPSPVKPSVPTVKSGKG
jgi:hypothetical protein